MKRARAELVSQRKQTSRGGQDERTDDAVPFSRWKRDAARGMHLRDETFPCSPFSVTARHGFLFAELPHADRRQEDNVGAGGEVVTGEVRADH